MKLFKIIFLLMIIGCHTNAIAQARFEIENIRHDFGEILEGTVASHEFVFTNTGDQPLIINNVRASCGCTTPYWTKEPVLPGKTGIITASYNSKSRPGAFNKSITVTSNAAENNKVLYIKGIVILPEGDKRIPTKDQMNRSPKIVVPKMIYDLGKVAINQSIPVPITLSNQGKSKLVIVNVVAPCKCVKIEPTANRIFAPGFSGQTNLLYTPRATGSIEEEVVIQTNDLHNPKTILLIRAEVSDKIGNENMLKEKSGIKF